MMTRSEISNFTFAKQFYERIMIANEPIKAVCVCHRLVDVDRILNKYTKLLDVFNCKRTIKKIDNNYNIYFKNICNHPVSILIKLAEADKYGHRILIIDDVIETKGE